jgi:hypothetical protein
MMFVQLQTNKKGAKLEITSTASCEASSRKTVWCGLLGSFIQLQTKNKQKRCEKGNRKLPHHHV